MDTLNLRHLQISNKTSNFMSHDDYFTCVFTLEVLLIFSLNTTVSTSLFPTFKELFQSLTISL